MDECKPPLKGPAPVRTFLEQAKKGRYPDLPTLADFSTCAVVGSSGSLLDRRLGMEIEAGTSTSAKSVKRTIQSYYP